MADTDKLVKVGQLDTIVDEIVDKFGETNGRLGDLKEDLNRFGVWESKGFTVLPQKQEVGFLDNNGDVTDANNGLVVKEYIEIEDALYSPYILEEYYSFKVCVYDSSKNFVAKMFYKYNDFLSNKTIDFKTLYPSAKYFRYGISSSSYLTVPVYVGCAFFRIINSYMKSIDNLNRTINSVSIPSLEHSGYLKNDGTYTGTSEYHSKTTQLIDCEEGDSFNYNGVGQYSAVSWIFYNGNAIVSSGTYKGETVVTIPSGVTSVVFSSYASVGTDVILEVSNVSLLNRIDGLETESYLGNGKIKNKKIGFDGDSICYGQGNNGGYAKILHDEYGMIIENIAVAGGTIANGTYYSGDTPVARHWICESVGNLSTDNDFIIVEGGSNDFWQSVPLGTISSGYSKTLDKSTFYGALETIFKILRTTFVSKKVGFIIVHKVNAGISSPNGAYYQAILECAKKWGVPVLDLNVTTPPLGLFDSNYQTIKDTYTVSGDGVHPNPQGYRTFYVPQIVSWLQTL